MALGAASLMSAFQIGMMAYQMHQMSQKLDATSVDSMEDVNAGIGDNNPNEEVHEEGKTEDKSNFMKVAGDSNKPKKLNGLGGFSSQ